MQAPSLSHVSDPACGGASDLGITLGRDTPGQSLGVTWEGLGSSHWGLSMFRPENAQGAGEEGGVWPPELRGSMRDFAASL